MTCRECQTLGLYRLDCLRCCVRLIRRAKDPRAAAEVIRRRMGEDWLDRVRQEWRTTKP